MDMLHHWILTAGDLLLGWLLHLPRDLALFVVAIGTALLLTVVRIWTTNQRMLQSCKQDKRTVKRLLKAAKKNKDKERVAQLQQTMGQIGMASFRSEAKPLLASLLPIIIIAMWCMGRIGYLPPNENEPVQLNVYAPVLQINTLAHVVPQEGVTAETGWVQKFTEDADEHGTIAAGAAEWSFRCKKRKEPYALEIRTGDRTITAELAVNGKKYSPPVTVYGDHPSEKIQVVLAEYKPFGVVPGAGGMQPWIIGYLLIVVPFSLLSKRLLKIY